ncbi:MbtH family protein [Runella sp.]|uniref:MbtH family protein n=1 Tax=Runella sp. TaxID=1960881 RepID=UPI003D0C1A0A
MENNIIYKVVINHEEMYSIYPADKPNALGWNDVGFSGTKEACMSHINELWTNERPKSLRDKMKGD